MAVLLFFFAARLFFVESMPFANIVVKVNGCAKRRKGDKETRRQYDDGEWLGSIDVAFIVKVCRRDEKVKEEDRKLSFNGYQPHATALTFMEGFGPEAMIPRYQASTN